MPINRLDIKGLKAKAKSQKESDLEKSKVNKLTAAEAGKNFSIQTDTKAAKINRAASRATGHSQPEQALKSFLHTNSGYNDKTDLPSEQSMVNIKSLVDTKRLEGETAEDLLELKKYTAFCQMQMQLQLGKGVFTGVENLPLFQKSFKPWLKEKGYESSLFETWIPQLNTAFFFDEIRIDPFIEKFFGTYNMKARSERINHLLGTLEGRRQEETDTYTPQVQSSTFIDFAAQDNVVHTEIYSNLLQDADPNAFNDLMNKIVEGLGIAREKAILYGDDSRLDPVTGFQGDAHMDSDIAAGDRFQAVTFWKGLRKLALDNSSNGVCLDHGGGSIDKSIFQDLIRAMPILAKHKSDCMWVMSTATKRAIDSGIIAELLNHDYVARGLIETGERNTLFGIPIYETMYMREDLGASGVYAADSNQTSLILVNKKRFFCATRSPIRLWASPALPNVDKLMMTGKERISFAGAKQSATEKAVALGYNIGTLGE